MVAQGADVCTYVFVCADVSGIPFCNCKHFSSGSLPILARYHLCHFICFAWSVCGMGAGEHVIADVIGIG